MSNIFQPLVRETDGAVPLNVGTGPVSGEVYNQHLTLDVNGAVFSSTSGAVNHWGCGLPFDVNGRLLVRVAEPDRFDQDIPFTSDNEVAIGDTIAYIDQGVGFTLTGRLFTSGGINPAIFSWDGRSLEPSIGDTLTFPTVGDTDRLRYIHDYEKLLRAVLAEEMRVYGMRRVENRWGPSSLAPTTKAITLKAVPHVLSAEGAGSITLSGAATGVISPGAYRRQLIFTPSAGAVTFTVSGDISSVMLEAKPGNSDEGVAADYIDGDTEYGMNVAGVFYSGFTNGNAVDVNNIVIQPG